MRTYCKERNLPVTEHGDGAVRLLLIGKVAIKDPAKEVLEPAQLGLDGLEMLAEWHEKRGEREAAMATRNALKLR